MSNTQDFLPNTDAGLAAWSQNFSDLIRVAPTDLGLTQAQVDAYAALNDAYQTAWTAASNPGTRGPSTITTKDDAKDALTPSARELAAIIQANPTTTNTQRNDLGLTVRATEPSPTPVPTKAPEMEILWTNGRVVRFRLRDVDNPTSRGKPAGVVGAQIMFFVGSMPPAQIMDWSFLTNTSRPLLDLEIPEAVPLDSKIWITAWWFNNKMQSGPAALPVTTTISGIGTQEQMSEAA